MKNLTLDEVEKALLIMETGLGETLFNNSKKQSEEIIKKLKTINALSDFYDGYSEASSLFVTTYIYGVNKFIDLNKEKDLEGRGLLSKITETFDAIACTCLFIKKAELEKREKYNKMIK